MNHKGKKKPRNVLRSITYIQVGIKKLIYMIVTVNVNDFNGFIQDASQIVVLKMIEIVKNWIAKTFLSFIFSCRLTLIEDAIPSDMLTEANERRQELVGMIHWICF